MVLVKYVYVLIYVSPKWGASPSQPIITILASLVVFTYVINVQNFITIGQKEFSFGGCLKSHVPIGKRSRP
jgi:hypothetical protein